MKGRIIGINPRNRFHAVLTEEGDITVFELLDSHTPELNDEISGALTSLGSKSLHNDTQRETFEAFVQDAHCSRARASDLLNR